MAEPSGISWIFPMAKGGTANTNNGVALADDNYGKRVGKASTAYDEIPMDTVTSRLSSMYQQFK